MRSAPMLRVMADEAAAPVSVFRQIAEASLRRDPVEDEIRVLGGLARPKDLPILAAAVRERCDGLVTFDERDYRPGYPGVEVVPPSVLVQRACGSVAATVRLARVAPPAGPDETGE